LNEEKLKLLKNVRLSKLRMSVLNNLKDVMINYGHILRKEFDASKK
jgi:hypothetical protein